MPRQRPAAIWFAEEPERKPRLSRDRITRAAVELLDAEGVAGLSMRRLAARLRAGTMSLYEYVGSREDVLDLAVDAVLAEIELDVDDDLPWPDALRRQMVRSRRVMLRHPWLPALTATRPLLGPHALAAAELLHALLVRAGLTGPRLTAAVGALTYYVQGFTAAENTWRTTVRDPAEETDLRRRTQHHLTRHQDRYPVLAEHSTVADTDFDHSFHLGLDTVLAGIRAQVGD
ncbi:TetR/AcrR family transcriptional regulator [Actinosynnema sp. NPDC059335]|uniref:TetR/AcrR family transcriptional regulator n=1 Tax=Actinosynnema sp. NPDC059335 TaxID=3346804 RepID=UPI00366ACD79